VLANLKICVLIVAAICASAWVVQRAELLYGGPALAGGSSNAPAQIFIALPIAALALAALCGRWLKRGDRAVLYAALVVGVPLTAAGLMHRFLPGLVTGFYGGFASPTGQYYRFLQVVPKWMVPGGPNEAPAVDAFEGGSAVPWGVWAVPLLCWTVFFLALFFTSLCLVLLLRRRWMETERLAFPLLELPLALIGGRDGEHSIWRSRAFWWGAAVPAVLFGVNGAGHYFPAVGEIENWLNLSDFLLDDPWKAMASFQARFIFEFSPLLIGVAFLAPVEVSFSTWFFFLLTRLQLLVTHFLGLSEYESNFVPGHGSPWLDWPAHAPFFMPQARGGLIFLALFSLWSARRTLKEAISARDVAAWGFLLGFCVLWAWIVAAGVPLVLAFGTLVFFFLLSIAYVRMRIDGGLPVTGVFQILGYLFFISLGTGPGVFADQTYVAFAFLGVLGYSAVGIWPALQFENLKLAEVCGVSAQRIIVAMCLGLVVGLGAGYLFSLETIYEHGLYTLREQGGGRGAALIGRFYNYLYRGPGTVEGDTDWARLLFHGLGAAVTWLLVFMRNLYLRWPLHPMGFIYGTGFGWLVWGPALMGWLCKWLTVRYGGARTYRRVRPFFLGMIFGELGMRLFWGGVALWQGQLGAGFRM
jgi:hypothetical protein